MALPRLERVDTKERRWHDLLQSIVKKLVAGSGVEAVYVFGSFATKQMSEASDLDIAVIVADGVDTNHFRKSIARPLSTWPLDLIIVNRSRFEERKDYGGVLFEVHVEGIELYPTWKLEEA